MKKLLLSILCLSNVFRATAAQAESVVSEIEAAVENLFIAPEVPQAAQEEIITLVFIDNNYTDIPLSVANTFEFIKARLENPRFAKVNAPEGSTNRTVDLRFFDDIFGQEDFDNILNYLGSNAQEKSVTIQQMGFRKILILTEMVDVLLFNEKENLIENILKYSTFQDFRRIAKHGWLKNNATYLPAILKKIQMEAIAKASRIFSTNNRSLKNRLNLGLEKMNLLEEYLVDNFELSIKDLYENTDTQPALQLFIDGPSVTLDVSNCGLTSLDGIELLDSWNSITTLDLNYNKIAPLSPNFFPTLPHLNALMLTNNGITTIVPHLFDTLPQLEILTLSFNKIEKLDPSAFARLTNLNNLFIQGNPHLSTIPYIRDRIMQNVPADCNITL